MEADGSTKHKQLTTGAVRFVRLTRELQHANDIDALKQDCQKLDAPNTVLDLKLTGSLKEADLATLNTWVEGLRTTFLHVARDQDLEHVLEAADIASRYPEGTLQHTLLTSLLADDEHPGDAHTALQLIEDLTKR